MAEQNVRCECQDGDEYGRCCPEEDAHCVEVFATFQTLEFSISQSVGLVDKVGFPRVELDNANPVENFIDKLVS